MTIIEKKHWYLLALILVAGILLIGVRWDDYREKNLVDVIDAEEIIAVLYSEDDPMVLDQEISDKESIQELIDFFAQYRVEKEGPLNFTSKHTSEQFSFQFIYADERITTPSLIERDVFLINQEQYTITNGPADYKWFENFIDEQN
ncbi:MAG TPA: hypothetical protein VK945_13130 [Planococcus sp. (in: firmicutes)]|nr:hypothetical protein [Planococcus sp. (in: firmicutes)]